MQRLFALIFDSPKQPMSQRQILLLGTYQPELFALRSSQKPKCELIMRSFGAGFHPRHHPADVPIDDSVKDFSTLDWP